MRITIETTNSPPETSFKIMKETKQDEVTLDILVEEILTLFDAEYPGASKYLDEVVNKWSTQRVYKSDNYVYSGATNAVVFKPRSSRKRYYYREKIQER